MGAGALSGDGAGQKSLQPQKDCPISDHMVIATLSGLLLRLTRPWA
jgi:hypothetical protein